MNDHIDEAVQDSQNRLIVRAIVGIGAVGVTLLLSCLGWVVMETMESRQFRMSGDRYTNQNAAVDRADMIDRISAIRDEVTRLKVLIERIEKGM